MTKRVFWVWPAMAIAVAACSGSTSNSGGGVTATQACTDLAGNVCDKFATCDKFFLQAFYGDATACKARAQLSCPAKTTATGSSVKASDIEACAQAYARITCDDLLAGNRPAACNVPGSLMPGVACAVDEQCSGATGYCKVAAGQTCGVCSARADAGGTCETNSDCGIGLVCANMLCVAPGAAGAMCDSTAHPCQGSLVCAGGTCATPAAAGAACNPTASTCPFIQGLYCSTASVCTNIKLANPGDACGLLIGTFCAANGNCKGATGVGNGTCEAAAADGATCDSTNGPKCMPGAVCTNGACKLPDPASCK